MIIYSCVNKVADTKMVNNQIYEGCKLIEGKLYHKEILTDHHSLSSIPLFSRC